MHDNTQLHDNTGSVLIIEDAGELLTKRDGPGGNAVSTLLKLSDGLLSDGFQIRIICTFNTDLTRIDKALLRKGHLIASYHFGPLAQPKSQTLVTALGQTEATLLVDIHSRGKNNLMSTPQIAPVLALGVAKSSSIQDWHKKSLFAVLTKNCVATRNAVFC